MRRSLLWLAVLVALVAAAAGAASLGDPVRTTGTAFTTAVADAIDNLAARLDETQLADTAPNAARLAELDQRIGALEPKPEPTVPASIAYEPAAPVVGDPVTFTVDHPVEGATYSWWPFNVEGLSHTYAYVGEGTKTVRLLEDGTQIDEVQFFVPAAPQPEPQPEPEPSGDKLAAYRITVQPGWLNKVDNPANDYHGMWLYAQSPTTPYRSPDSQKQVARYLLLDPRYRDADGHQGNDDWWFIIERNWPNAPAWDPFRHGTFGRLSNFHTVAGDAGSAECGCGGVGWGFGEGVSPLALDWLSQPEPTITVQDHASTRNMKLPVPARNEWHTYVVHWVAGRTDGTTLKPGSIEVWADGVKVIDRQRINTLQRAQGPDGKWYVPRWVQLWEGDYTTKMPQSATQNIALARVGPSYLAALADRPTLKGTNIGTAYRAYGSAPPPTIEPIEYTAGQSRLPELP